VDARKARPVPFELAAKVAAALPEWMRPAVTLGVGAGLRQGEVSGLKADRVDLQRREIRIDHPEGGSSHRIIRHGSLVRAGRRTTSPLMGVSVVATIVAGPVAHPRARRDRLLPLLRH
jgi:integrase